LEDIALPLLKKSDSEIELKGALLFHQGKNTSKKLDKDQARMVMFLLGKDMGRQRLTGHMSEKDDERHSYYAVYVKKVDSKITVHPETYGLPKVNFRVRLRINSIEADESVQLLNNDSVNRIEKELSKHMEEQAMETIKTLQKANCDLLGIGKQLKAYHPNLWKSLHWSKDYPQLAIKPNFEVQIINPDIE
jgi:spore germination protein KC